MAQVTLKVKDEEGNIHKQHHEIEDIDLLQFEQMMKVIKDIFVQLQEDDSLKQLFTDLFDGAPEDSEEIDGESDDQERQDYLQDQQFIQNMINSFETLAVHMPAKAIHLLSVLSGIEVNTLQRQKMLDVFEIYDAVIDENDIERLVKRAKKSLAATKVKMSFMKITRKATQTQKKQA